jgi:hypothetical protein
MQIIRAERDLEKIRAITNVPDGPKNLLLGLNRFPSVSVTRLKVRDGSYNDLRNRMEVVSDEIGEIPFAGVVCRAGIYRSNEVAQALVDDNTVVLSWVNSYKGKLRKRGYGISDLELHGLSYSPRGFKLHPDDRRYFEALVLAYSQEVELTRERESLTKVAMMLEQGLSTRMDLFNPLAIIWLDGIEDDFPAWLQDAKPNLC